MREILKDKRVEYSFRELSYTIKSGRAVVGYYEHEIFKDRRLYVNRPTKMSDELAEILRILKIRMLRHDLFGDWWIIEWLRLFFWSFKVELNT